MSFWLFDLIKYKELDILVYFKISLVLRSTNYTPLQMALHICFTKQISEHLLIRKWCVLQKKKYINIINIIINKNKQTNIQAQKKEKENQSKNIAFRDVISLIDIVVFHHIPYFYQINFFTIYFF